MPEELPIESDPVMTSDTPPSEEASVAVAEESAPVAVLDSPAPTIQPLAGLTSAPEADAEDADAPIPVPPEEGEVVAEAAVAIPEPPAPSNKHWYVVKVQSNREDTIKAAIERKVRIEGLEEFYGQILIPVEKIQELRRGKRVTKSIKLYPGYIFAELEFNDRMLYLFRETSGVGDFVGASAPGKPPTPMRQAEVDAMLNRQPTTKKDGEEGSKEPEEEVIRTRPRFSVGDRLRVIDGNFATMEGEVIDITEDKVKLQVLVLGMPVTMDLDFWQVEVA